MLLTIWVIIFTLFLAQKCCTWLLLCWDPIIPPIEGGTCFLSWHVFPSALCRGKDTIVSQGYWHPPSKHVSFPSWETVILWVSNILWWIRSDRSNSPCFLIHDSSLSQISSFSTLFTVGHWIFQDYESQPNSISGRLSKSLARVLSPVFERMGSHVKRLHFSVYSLWSSSLRICYWAYFPFSCW